MTMAQIKSYSQGTVSPIEFAADTQDADLFSLLVQDLETRKGKLGDVRFNCIRKPPSSTFQFLETLGELSLRANV